MKPIQKQKIYLLQELQSLGIRNEKVLNAIKKIPRELFVTAEYKIESYANIALPIEHQQTISQPYIVAKMTQALCNSGSMNKVLEVVT